MSATLQAILGAARAASGGGGSSAPAVLFGTVRTGSGGVPQSVTSPGALVGGDVLFAIQVGDRTPAPALGSGFTSVSTGATPFGFYRVSYKVCGGSEPGTYSFDNPGGVGAHGVVLFAYRGVDTTTPLEGFVEANVSSNATQTTAGATATLANSILLTFFTDENNLSQSIATPPAGTQLILFTGGSIATFAVYAQGVGAGATGSRTLVWNSTAWGMCGSFIIRSATP